MPPTGNGTVTDTALMLIDTRREPPPSPQPGRPRRWQFSGWRWLAPMCAGFVLIGLSNLFPPFPAYILIVGSLVMIVRGLSRMGGSAQGLRDYRQ